MTNINSPSIPSLSAEQVEDYLWRHPHFLIDRPELLAALNIQHDTPDNVASLIERQISLLRNEHTRLQKQLAASTDNLKAQQALTERALDTSLKLLEAGSLEALYGNLQEFTRQHYDTEHISLSLFLDRDLPIGNSVVSVLGRNDKLRILLVELFNRQQPLFDSLQHEHLDLLFGKSAGDVHSTALLPLFGNDWDGLLALGSCSRDRYHRGQAFELLKYLTRITAFKLDRWLWTDAG